MLRVEASTGLRGFALDVAFEVPGGCLALAGPSGAGKTTLLRIVAGLARPAAGRVECGGETWLDTARGVNAPPEARRCGMLFQDGALFPHLRAWENVAYGLRGTAGGRQARRARAEALLDRFGVRELALARPRELSGGERRRVALARALAVEPRALLLDEPFAGLDVAARAAAAREVERLLREARVPALLVTHDFGEAALLGDEVAVLDAGHIVQRGAAAAIAAAPASAFVADLTGANVLLGTAAPGPEGLTEVVLDGGGRILSTDTASGRVAASVFPWEVALEPAGEPPHGSARNRVEARVVTVTPLGNRVRVGLAAPQPLTAEVTGPAARRLAAEPGAPVVATWKATATRLAPR